MVHDYTYSSHYEQLGCLVIVMERERRKRVEEITLFSTMDSTSLSLSQIEPTACLILLQPVLL